MTTPADITLAVLQFLLALGGLAIAAGFILKLIDQRSVFLYGASAFTAIIGALWLIGKLF